MSTNPGVTSAPSASTTPVASSSLWPTASMRSSLQAADVLKAVFHVNDAALGVVPFAVSIVGNVTALGVAWFCARHARTMVLAAMFVIWGVFVAVAGLSPTSILGSSVLGFAFFAVARTASASMEATDPAAYPLIADWWPVERRAAKISVFNTLSAVGS